MVVGGCPVCYRMFNNNPDLHPLDASSFPPPVCNNQKGLQVSPIVPCGKNCSQLRTKAQKEFNEAIPHEGPARSSGPACSWPVRFRGRIETRKRVTPNLGSQAWIHSKFFLAAKYLARSFTNLLPCRVFHLFLWFPVTFISHSDVYGYKEAERSPVLTTLVWKHSPS